MGKTFVCRVDWINCITRRCMMKTRIARQIEPIEPRGKPLEKASVAEVGKYSVFSFANSSSRKVRMSLSALESSLRLHRTTIPMVCSNRCLISRSDCGRRVIRKRRGWGRWGIDSEQIIFQPLKRLNHLMSKGMEMYEFHVDSGERSRDLVLYACMSRGR
jgi:hypothetical protein